MPSHRRSLGLLAAATAAGALLLCAPTPFSAGAQTSDQARPTAPAHGRYAVYGAKTPAQFAAISATGVDILGHVHPNQAPPAEALLGVRTDLVATPRQADKLRALGLDVQPRGDWDAQLLQRSKGTGGPARPNDFPPGDEAYHNYDRLVQEIKQDAQNHRDLVKVGSIGKSVEGRDLPLVEISGAVSDPRPKPEVLFTCNMHAREHLTAEMCLHIVKRLADGYQSDPAIKDLVDKHRIWVIPNQNPDGTEFDISGGQYHGWRKNRQPNAGSTDVGTDQNRNFDYQWGCCGGSSTNPADEDYRGPAAASAPEVKAVQDFAASRVVGGVQQLKSHIDFHTYSELVMWPFGWTKDHVAPGMTQPEYDRFQSLGKELANTNGYTPEQDSDLYIVDGAIDDYMWAKHKMLSLTFEMFPKESGPEGFYPPGKDIPQETTRNDKAVDLVIKASDGSV